MSGGTSGTQNNTQQGGMNSNSVPQWLQGLQAGQQIAALGSQRPQMPQAPMGRPMGQIGMPQGMPQQGVVPGAQGMQPPMPSQAPGMATGGQGMQQGVNPQMLQMLRQRGLMS